MEISCRCHSTTGGITSSALLPFGLWAPAITTYYFLLYLVLRAPNTTRHTKFCRHTFFSQKWSLVKFCSAKPFTENFSALSLDDEFCGLIIFVNNFQPCKTQTSTSVQSTTAAVLVEKCFQLLQLSNLSNGHLQRIQMTKYDHIHELLFFCFYVVCFVKQQFACATGISRESKKN